MVSGRDGGVGVAGVRARAERATRTEGGERAAPPEGGGVRGEAAALSTVASSPGM